MRDIKLFIKNVKKYHKYAIRLAKAELKSEVADSYLNWLWWVIEPLCFMLIYTFVFGYVFKNDTPYFATFVFIGLSAWDFFNRMMTGSVGLIVKNKGLVTKVYIPKYILLLSKSYTYLFKMGISFLIVFLLIIFQGVPFTPYMLFIIPVLIVLYIFSFSIGMLLMHFGVLLNDLANLTRIGLRMLFYLSGVFYNIRKRLGGKVQYILLRVNPIAFLMDELRKALLESQMPSFEGLIFWLLIGVILGIIGIKTIHKNENSYAKVV